MIYVGFSTPYIPIPTFPCHIKTRAFRTRVVGACISHVLILILCGTNGRINVDHSLHSRRTAVQNSTFVKRHHYSRIAHNDALSATCKISRKPYSSTVNNMRQ
jgi:hypothetical protein